MNNWLKTYMKSQLVFTEAEMDTTNLAHCVVFKQQAKACVDLAMVIRHVSAEARSGTSKRAFGSLQTFMMHFVELNEKMKYVLDPVRIPATLRIHISKQIWRHMGVIGTLVQRIDVPSLYRPPLHPFEFIATGDVNCDPLRMADGDATLHAYDNSVLPLEWMKPFVNAESRITEASLFCNYAMVGLSVYLRAEEKAIYDAPVSSEGTKFIYFIN
jgi:hypothetical protein